MEPTMSTKENDTLEKLKDMLKRKTIFFSYNKKREGNTGLLIH
jgi:hypothetical protein